MGRFLATYVFLVLRVVRKHGSLSALSFPAGGIPRVTAIVGLWPSTGARLTVVFLTFSVLAQGEGGLRIPFTSTTGSVMPSV